MALKLGIGVALGNRKRVFIALRAASAQPIVYIDISIGAMQESKRVHLKKRSDIIRIVT